MSQELRQRNRHKNHETSSNGATTVGAADANNDTTINQDSPQNAGNWMSWLSAFVHISAIIIVVIGFVLRISFHSGIECDMTFSMRHFLLLQNNVPQHPIYRVFKFTDLRDARQRHLHPQDSTRYDEWSFTSSSDWCTAPKNETTTIVLYVPGHWGSFSQARSLGAHGLQWTRARDDVSRIQREGNLMQSGEWNGLSRDLDKFVYDVYTIDFAEQGGALHANFLYAQSNYVAQVVMALVVSEFVRGLVGCCSFVCSQSA